MLSTTQEKIRPVQEPKMARLVPLCDLQYKEMNENGAIRATVQQKEIYENGTTRAIVRSSIKEMYGNEAARATVRHSIKRNV